MVKSRINNITVLHLIKFLSSLYFYHQIMTLYFQARGLNYIQINSLWGILVGTQALAEVPTGVIADKIGRKKSIIIALALQFLGEILFIFAVNYFLFLLVCIIAGIGFSFSSGCFEAMMYDSLKMEGRENDMQKVAGLNGSFALVAIIIGSFVGGFITSDLQMNSFICVILATAFFVFLALLVSLFLTEPAHEYNHSEDSSFKLLHDGITVLKTNKSLQRIIILSLLATPFINYLLNFYQPYFVTAGVQGFWFGIALAIASLLGVITSKYAYLLEKKLGVQNGVLIAVLCPGIFYLLISIISHSLISIVLVILAFGSMHIQKPLFLDYINRHIESKNRATILSLINVLSGFYVAIMGLLIGWIADIGLNYSFIFMGCIIITSALLVRINEHHVTINKKE
ncbi:MFS transporter [Candidatus Latescibacterota bacterium]